MKKMNNEAYESIKSMLIEECYKRNLNYSEFMENMMDEMNSILLKAELEEWD